MMEPNDSTQSDSLVLDLTSKGARQLDPAGLHYIETLSRRASAQQGRVRQLLEDKIGLAARALIDRLAHAPTQVQTTDARDTSARARESLQDLVRSMAHDRTHTPSPLPSLLAPGHIARPELKSVQNFRNTWSKLSVDKQVTQALARAPKNAGPLNSHLVALRSLALMRNISPDYLNRFISYVDTLQRLDQSERDLLPPHRASPAGKVSAKKPKANRA
jgi:hypothetical protein